MRNIWWNFADPIAQMSYLEEDPGRSIVKHKGKCYEQERREDFAKFFGTNQLCEVGYSQIGNERQD